MTSKENIIDEINYFKQHISEIDDHTDDSSFFYELSKRATWIARDIEKIHSGYYLAFMESGPEDNFVRLCYPLGFMTAEKAYKILKEDLIGNDLEDWHNSGIKEVDKEKFYRYYDLIDLQRLYDSLYHSQYDLRDLLPSGFIDKLGIKVEALRNELGFTRPWMHLCTRD